MGHLPYSLGPLSMMVEVVTLLPNEMVVMGANYFVWKNIGRNFNYFFCVSARYFEWVTTRSLFSMLWEILMEICALVAKKIRWQGRASWKYFAEINIHN